MLNYVIKKYLCREFNVEPRRTTPNMGRFSPIWGLYSPNVGRKLSQYRRLGATWGDGWMPNRPSADILSPAHLQAAIFMPPGGPTIGDALSRRVQSPNCGARLFARHNRRRSFIGIDARARHRLQPRSLHRSLSGCIAMTEAGPRPSIRSSDATDKSQGDTGREGSVRVCVQASPDCDPVLVG